MAAFVFEFDRLWAFLHFTGLLFDWHFLPFVREWIAEEGLMKARNLFTPAVGCAALVLVSGELQADAWQKEPSYGVELGYNDNYTLQPEPTSAAGQDKIQAVSTLKAKAGLALIQLKPSYTAKIEGKLIATTYGGDVDGYVETTGGEVDTDDDGNVIYGGTELKSRVDGVVEMGLEKRQERAVWRLDAIVLTDSLLADISLDTDVENEVDNDDGSVRDDVTRTRFTITPSYLYRMSAISNFQGSISAAMASYDNTPNTDLRDYSQFKINGIYSREFTPVNSWSVDAEIQDFEADDAGQFDSISVGLGVRHKFSETTDIGLRIAQSNADFEYQTGYTVGGVGETRFTSGNVKKPLVQVTGSKNTGRTTYTLRLGTNLFGSASGEVVAANEALFNVRYQFSELMTLTWRNKFFENKSLRDKLEVDANNPTNFVATYNNSIDDTNRRYLAFEPTLNWRFSRWWVMDAGLRYQREKRDILGNSGESTYAFVGVTFSKPLGVQPES